MRNGGASRPFKQICAEFRHATCRKQGRERAGIGILPHRNHPWLDSSLVLNLQKTTSRIAWRYVASFP